MSTPSFYNRVSRSNLYCTSIDLSYIEGRHKYAIYSYFSVGNPSATKTLSVGGYSETAGDSLAIGFAVHNGRELTTHDRDNDRYSGGITVLSNGKVPGGMICKCHVSDLNGQYLSGGNDNHSIGCGKPSIQLFAHTH